VDVSENRIASLGDTEKPKEWSTRVGRLLDLDLLKDDGVTGRVELGRCGTRPCGRGLYGVGFFALCLKLVYERRGELAPFWFRHGQGLDSANGQGKDEDEDEEERGREENQ
jgi:hypothetical protein